MNKANLKILHVSPEVAPFSKSGGLGDVSAALPAAQARLGADVRTLTPFYRHVKGVDKLDNLRMPAMLHVGESEVAAAFIEQRANSKSRIIFLDLPQLYDRDGLYVDPEQNRDYGDNDLRFAALSHAALEYCRKQNWFPDIIHCHDWQAGITPLLLNNGASPEFAETRTAFTIHNMAYQGLFPRSSLRYLPEAEKYFTLGGPIEFHGMVSFLKTALEFSDEINTVSPTYAQEIQSSREFGFGLEEVLAARSARFRGILNGIDTDIWNPGTDPLIHVNYSRHFVAKKLENKKALCSQTGLIFSKNIPLIGMITRITEQKGFEILHPVLTDLLDLPAQLVILGTGDHHYEHILQDFARNFPDRLHVSITYDDAFAHQIEAGADLFLMPSKYEPCGLNQMMSMRYGTPPIVRRTGGLADSVIDADDFPSTGTGFLFTEYSAMALLQAVQRAIDAYHDTPRWRAIKRRAMAQDFSWEHAAASYLEMYADALRVPARRVG